MDLIDREKALGCFWNYANDDGTGYDETEMPAYDRLQALPIVKEVEDCISRQAAITALMEDAPEVWTDSDYELGMMNQHKYDVNVIKALPSAQPTQNNTSNALKSLDCVDRQTVIDELLQIVQDRYSWQKDASEQVRGINAAICAIEKLPSAQPGIIRCKDCVYWDSLPSSSLAPEYHECVVRPFHIDTTAEDFCSRAERRQG